MIIEFTNEEYTTATITKGILWWRQSLNITRDAYRQWVSARDAQYHVSERIQRKLESKRNWTSVTSIPVARLLS